MAERTRRKQAPAERPRTPSEDATRPPQVAEAEDASVKVDRLRQRVSKLRIRGWSFDVPRLLMVGGGAMLILGLVLVMAGWYGAAHTPFLFEQVPYLISGGLFGLGLTFVGSSFYFGYWLTRQVQETKRQAQRNEEALARVERALMAVLEERGGSSRPAGRGSTNGSFVATASGSMFHRPDCAVVAGRPDLKRVSADATGLEPCRMCDPLGAEPART